MLNFIKKTFSFKGKDVLISPYNSLVRPNLEHARQFWSPYNIKDITKLAGVQHRDTKMISLLNKSLDKRLSSLKALEKHYLWGKLIKCLEIFSNNMYVDQYKFFLVNDMFHTRNKQLNSECPPFFFTLL